MPDRKTIKRAKAKLAAGDKPSTAAGEFVREEMDHIREGKHGARSTKQAIAIGLSKARRAGVPVTPRRSASKRTRAAAKRENDEASGKRTKRAPSKRRALAAEKALKREPRAAASHRALSRHAKAVARRKRR